MIISIFTIIIQNFNLGYIPIGDNAAGTGKKRTLRVGFWDRDYFTVRHKCCALKKVRAWINGKLILKNLL